MTEKRFTDDGIEEIENQSFTDNLTGKTYWIDHGLDEIVDLLNSLTDENEQLRKELSEYKDFVLSDDKILCYTCLFCTHKGIYEVDCDVKGHVDVHGSCLSYTKKRSYKND